MSTLKEETMRVHTNTDFRKDFVGITKKGEFKYTHGGIVAVGRKYHIHYTKSKREIYMTLGTHISSSKIIEKIGGKKTLFSHYTEIKQSVRTEYPSKFRPYPTDNDYKIGTITRYFAQKANNLNGYLHEVYIDTK